VVQTPGAGRLKRPTRVSSHRRFLDSAMEEPGTILDYEAWLDSPATYGVVESRSRQ
jgi:hypothetical protein